MAYSSPWQLPDSLATPKTPWSDFTNMMDPLGARYDTFSSWAPAQMYGYGNAPRGGYEYDPIPMGETYSPLSTQLGFQSTNDSIDAWLQKTYPNLYDFSQPGGDEYNPGQIATLGGDWAHVDQWDSQIQQVARNVQIETGTYVPLNVIKSVMRIESNGDPNAGPAYGLLQMTNSTLSNATQYQLDLARTDPVYGLMLGVKELALRYKDAKAQNKDYGWSNAIVGFFSGHYEPNGAADSLHTSDYDYLNQFNTYMTQLGQGSQAGGTATPGTKQWKSVMGGFDAPITQEYGPTDFSASSGSYYDYGAAYTLDGKPMGHPGVDIGVTYGSHLFSPADGTVTMAGGTGYYSNEDANGNKIDGPQIGELMITMDNGDQIILGHMSQITAHIGDRVAAGSFVGYSGQENGAHVHLEYRKYLGDPGTGTTSGYLLQDPRNALDGIFTGTYGASGSGPRAAANPYNWQSFMEAAAQGLPLTGQAPGQGGFHDWLFTHMNGQQTPDDTSQAPSSWTYTNDYSDLYQ